MTTHERQQLNSLLEKLEDMRNFAPMQTTYSQGRIQANIASKLMDVINDVKELLEVDNGSKKSE